MPINSMTEMSNGHVSKTSKGDAVHNNIDNADNNNNIIRETTKKSPLELISQGVCLPSIPTHPTFGQHRQWMLEKMALAFRVFARKGYTEGLAGHISVRDPEWTNTFWTVGRIR